MARMVAFLTMDPRVSGTILGREVVPDVRRRRATESGPPPSSPVVSSMVIPESARS